MIFRISIVVFLNFTVCFSQFKSTPPKQLEDYSIQNSITDDAFNSLNNSLDVIQSPFYFDGNDFIMTAAIIAITGASFSLDNDVRHDIAKTKSKGLDGLTYIGEKFGRPVYPTILAALLYSGGFFINNSKMKETAQILTESMIATGFYTTILKSIFGRARPFTGDPFTDIDFLEFEFGENENSLPSGHTSIAFVTATVLSERIDNIFASVALYSLASLTAFQRIYSDVHWFSDTILGAALGTFIGLKVISLHERNKQENKNFELNFFPQINSSGYGVGFAVQF